MTARVSDRIDPVVARQLVTLAVADRPPVTAEHVRAQAARVAALLPYVTGNDRRSVVRVYEDLCAWAAELTDAPDFSGFRDFNLTVRSDVKRAKPTCPRCHQPWTTGCTAE